MIPSRELAYSLLRALLKMMFIFSRWDILIAWRGIHQQNNFKQLWLDFEESKNARIVSNSLGNTTIIFQFLCPWYFGTLIWRNGDDSSSKKNDLRLFLSLRLFVLFLMVNCTIELREIIKFPKRRQTSILQSSHGKKRCQIWHMKERRNLVMNLSVGSVAGENDGRCSTTLPPWWPCRLGWGLPTRPPMAVGNFCLWVRNLRLRV